MLNRICSCRNHFFSSAVFFLCILCATFFFSCKPQVYEIVVSDELFTLSQKENFFTEESRSPFYTSGNAFEIYSDKKISINAVTPDAISSLRKPPLKLAELKTGFYFGKNYTSNTNFISVEIKNTYYFPCVPFMEDPVIKSMPYSDCSYFLPPDFTDKATDCLTEEESSEENNFTEPLLLELQNIPSDYVAIPVNKGTEEQPLLLYPDNSEYPLYNSIHADCRILAVPPEILNNNRKTESFEKAQKICMSAFINNFIYALPKETASPEVITIAAAGDIMLARGVENLLLNEKKPEAVFTDTTPVLQNNDITIGNLEGVVTDLTLKTPKTYNFKFKKEALPYLKKAGFDYLMLTNNHSYDYGEQGFKDTLKAVKEEGFATSGAGYNKTEAENFYHTNIKEKNISILSVGAYPVERSGFNGAKQAAATDERAGILWKSDNVLEMVKKEKDSGSIVIVNVHAGSEYVKKPNETQTTFYKQLCDCGADVVFGSHPHILQPVEKYNDSLIVWSLGNFVFPGMEEMPGATDTMIIRTGFAYGRLLYYEKFPARINDKTVSLIKNN